MEIFSDIIFCVEPSIPIQTQYGRYSILTLSLCSLIMSAWGLYSRQPNESILSTWSAILVVLLGIGGTMVMRKYHNGLFVGIFMGSLVGLSQFFFMVFLM